MLGLGFRDEGLGLRMHRVSLPKKQNIKSVYGLEACAWQGQATSELSAGRVPDAAVSVRSLPNPENPILLNINT